MANDDSAWDAGLHQGIAKREGGKPPAYYAESGMPVRIAKAIGLAIAAVAPYLTVLDTLGSLKGDVFVPCSNFSCHYIQLFRADVMPGSGVGMMSVQNGVAEAVGFNINFRDHDRAFTAYACPRVSPQANKTRNFKEKLYGDPCPHINGQEYRSFLGSHPSTHHIVMQENDRIDQASSFLRAAYTITKLPMWAYTYLFTVISKHSDLWGMEYIPSAQCPHKSTEEMIAECEKPDVRSRIHNHMKEYKPTKILVVAGLLGCALFSAIHDICLLTDQSEMVSMPLGALAAVMQGAAVAAVFLWTMGATGVFVSKFMSERDEVECVCYYQLPELTQLVALSTPFALLMAFYARVQLAGLASLFGDHLFYMRFDVPYFLAKQSTLWTWGVLMTPKAAGTIQAKKREELNFKTLCTIQQGLFHYRNAVMACVGLAAGPFMVSSKELLYSMLLPGHNLTPLMRSMVLYVALPLPALIAGVMGAYAVYEVANITATCNCNDEGESFADELNTMLPNCIFTTETAKWMKESDTSNILGKFCFWVCSSLVLVLTATTVFGLTPDFSLLLGWSEPHRASLLQAELWGACGFVFMVLQVNRLFAGYVFSTWDDLESLVLERTKQEESPMGNKMTKAESRTLLAA